ncbi:solute carrier family 66 member 3 [Culicoides brevitarsis]|uniref:solute carrier family 66 member 3 n=1 Tax=Culicoides brevitarsis TaxID=469753 RepID=UPI00307C9FAE
MGQGILYIISDILSLLTISTCIYCKVPQIQSVRSLRSAEGLSVTGLLMETCSYTVSMLYNYVNRYALLNYLEYPILLLQEYVLVYYVLLYKGILDGRNCKIFIGIYWLVAFFFAFNVLPAWILVVLLPFTTPVSATSKVLQLVEILRTKESETVSLMTWFISAFSNATRIYTVMLDSGDAMLLANFTVSTVLSSLVLLAAWYYKKPKQA